MRITTSLLVVAVVACGCTLRARASDIPAGHLEGFRCELTMLPGFPTTMILVCTADDGEPIGHSALRLPPSTTADAALESLRRPGIPRRPRESTPQYIRTRRIP